MKIVLDYKKGWFGRFRKLKIYLDGDIHLTDMKQGQRTEVEITEKTESLFGNWKHAQSYRSFGKKSLPIRIVIRNKDGFQKHISPETQ